MFQKLGCKKVIIDKKYCDLHFFVNTSAKNVFSTLFFVMFSFEEVFRKIQYFVIEIIYGLIFIPCLKLLKKYEQNRFEKKNQYAYIHMRKLEIVLLIHRKILIQTY